MKNGKWKNDSGYMWLAGNPIILIYNWPLIVLV